MKYQKSKEVTDQIKSDLEEIKIEPSQYQVVMHNDDFTPMEFVVGVLEKFFYMSRAKAAEVMLEAHTKGVAVCGYFVKDTAETKISEIIDYARLHEHPLSCSMDVAI
jgi:ATP-dependent Clp protease adaptor protein ClpS